MFSTNYKKWKQECVHELKEKGFARAVEICEDGRVLLPGSTYLTDPIVTPWKESIFYIS